MRRAPRTPVRLSLAAHRRLNMYALVAGASGVGCLALATPSAAEVVYTPANQIIFRNGSYALDLTNNGSTDFVIRGRSESSTSGHLASIYIAAAAGNTVEGDFRNITFTSPFDATALQAGSLIPTKVPSKTKAVMAWHCSGFIGCNSSTLASSVNRGHWFNVTSRYLGLKFTIQGQTHYGWARLSVHFLYPKLTAVLTGYAYETLPDTPIFAGSVKTSQSASLNFHAQLRPTLGALALGSGGLSIWRREEA